jgi:hypothetical protein
LHRLARRRGVELWSVDECHFQQHGTRCRVWVPPEIKDPVLFHVPIGRSVACFGAISLSTGTFVRSLCATFNAATFKTFLKMLLWHRSRGHAALLKPLLRKYRAGPTLLFPPPYYLPPARIERVWKLPAVWRHTTCSSPPWTHCSQQSQRASTAGEHPTRAAEIVQHKLRCRI